MSVPPHEHHEAPRPRSGRRSRPLYVAYGILSGLKEAIQYGLVFTALIAALFATRLLREESQIEVRAEVRRLIALQAGDEISVSLKNYNHSVRRAEGTTSLRLGDSVLTWLDPGPGSAESEQTLHSELGNSIAAIIRPSPETNGWTVQTADDPDNPRQVAQWPLDLEGCDERIIILDELYGPVACGSPTGTIVALDTSPGVPSYALELLLANLPGGRMEAILKDVEQTFRLEAKLTILNEGEATAKGIQLVTPPGWTVPESWRPGSNDPRCNDTGETEDRGFSLASLQSCVVTYVTGSDSRDVLPLTPPTFEAVPETAPLINIVVWILVAALVLMVLYLIADIVVNWQKRTAQANG